MNIIAGLAVLFVFFGPGTSSGQPVADSLVATPSESPVPGSHFFVSFACDTRDAKRVALQWEVDSITEDGYFIIERSNQEGPYESIGVIRAAIMNTHYESVDSSPPSGSNFYRIRYADKSAHPVYSQAISVSIMGEVDFKFYPNPVDKLLIIRTEHLIDIQIIDAFGSVRLSKRLQKGIQVIDAGLLERGSYILRVADKESNRVVSSQLLKN
ncbi:MAG: T9SS type A sorting domain-containing protein [Puia sp.]|nr:T9SS type A sorting domain-containing protein [Puia sp.]